ncbi:metal-dependent transcriptional regulator [Halobellus marinus]|uniref:metal-dependent transcriptional regulator n=1 Tax=Halobellus TaxID=1073986 RepID=UPI00360F556D
MAASISTEPQSECTYPSECADRRDGRYLTAAYWLTTDDSNRISTSALSDRLDVTPATVTEMFGRLDASGFVDYTKHAGIRLTDRGMAIGRELAWRQCIVRRFFAIELDFRLDADSGYRFGYVLSGDEIETLRRLIGSSPEDTCHNNATHGNNRLGVVDDTTKYSSVCKSSLTRSHAVVRSDE